MDSEGNWEEIEICQNKKKQVSISAGEGFNVRQTGYSHNYLGQVWEMPDRRIMDSQ